ncbi:uncharacterized protein LOC114534753 [Dendronephthya gigantea]|uniref:uncharacterized protein LOC114534753 n=1 Tax=Dendronephthya gigantea TaxID=151771 RepID=UPI001068ED80|nr:uncharacterized protein LOC114534753 [Dendronephthya gigantea]
MMSNLLTQGVVLLGVLSLSAALLCTDAEYAITVKTVPKTLSYEQAILNCKSDGKLLCNSQTICKNGVPYTGVIPGDHWVPVSDSANEWAQIGNRHRSCSLHSSLGQKPLWGLWNSANNFKGNLFCCKIKVKDPKIFLGKVSNRLSYQQAQTKCRNKGKNLCSSKDLCSDGKTPYGGPIAGDNWVPVSDSFNEWLQLGKSPHPPCRLHSSIGVKPAWGLKTGAPGVTGILPCCRVEPKDAGISMKNVPPTTSYQQAVSKCTSYGKQLCNSQDICEDGKTPSGGPMQGDHWVPVKDSYNEWLQLGKYCNCVLLQNLQVYTRC